MNLLDVPSMCSSEYWKVVLQNGWGCMIGSFLGVGITVLIYWLTTKNSRKDKAILEQQSNTDTRTYFTLTVKGMLSIAAKQLENLKRFRDSIAVDPTVYPLLPYTPMYEFKRVSESQNLDKILQSFTSLLPTNAIIINYFANLISNVDYINAQMEVIIKQIEKAQTYDHDRKKQLKVEYLNLYAFVGDLLSQDPYNYTVPVRQALEKVVTDFHTKQGTLNELKFVYDEFVIPLQASMQQLYNANERGQVVMQLGSMSVEAVRLYEEMKRQIESVADDTKENTDSLIEHGFDPLRNNAAHLGIHPDE